MYAEATRKSPAKAGKERVDHVFRSGYSATQAERTPQGKQESISSLPGRARVQVNVHYLPLARVRIPAGIPDRAERRCSRAPGMGTEIAHLLGICTRTVRNWLRLYRQK